MNVRRTRLEDIFHKAVARFLDLALPDDACWTTIPAGGGGKVRGAKLKAMGYKPGWPDILIIYRQQAFNIELKAPQGRLSKAQKDRHPLIRNAGAPIAICQRIEEVEGSLRGWGIPLRATTGQRGEAA